MYQICKLRHCKSNVRLKARGHTGKLGESSGSWDDIQVRVYLPIQAPIYTTGDGLCTIT